ncbi:MAG: hypothetical protein FWC11_06425, partial [Firmicutes bacterium]|nr:hypothetical protein [Bacillota bacterium]
MRRQSQGKGQRITALIFGIVLGVAILSGGIACMSLGIAAVADAGYITDTGVSDGFAIAGQLMLVLGIVGMVSGVFAIIGGAITMAGKTA